jgi:hypothetical protein
MKFLFLTNYYKRLVDLFSGLLAFDRELNKFKDVGLALKLNDIREELKIAHTVFSKNVHCFGWLGALFSVIPFTEPYKARLAFAKKIASLRPDIHKILTYYQENLPYVASPLLHFKITQYCKDYFSSFSKVFLIMTASLICLVVAVLCLGALAEDNSETAQLVGLFSAKALIVLFIFVAHKLPILLLVKFTALSSWLSLVAARVASRPGKFWRLITFSTEEVYLCVNKSWRKSLLVALPWLKNNKMTSAEMLIFALNPFNILLNLLSLVKNLWLLGIDTMPFNPRGRQRLPSPIALRIAKGLMVLLCELIALPILLLQRIIQAIILSVQEVITVFWGDKTVVAISGVAEQACRTLPLHFLPAAKKRSRHIISTASYITRQLNETNDQ